MTRSSAVSVLVVSPPSTVWGAQLYLLDQVAGLRERGVELTLGTPANSPFGEAWLARGFPLLELGLELHEGLRKPGSSDRPGIGSIARSGLGVAKGVGTIRSAAKDFDVLHSFAMRSHLEVAIAGRLANRGVALDLVNIVRPGIGRRALQLASDIATITVANSQASRAVLAPRTRTTVIHPGVDLDRFHPGAGSEAIRADLGTDAPLVAIVGRIDVRKGIQDLVAAMGMLGPKVANANLVVVGEAGTGPEEFARELEANAVATLGDRVHFLGRRSDIPDILRTVDVLVNASVAEPFGLTALEAQACRTPVIGTDAGGLVEFVTDGETGLLVPPGQPAAMATAIERILTDEPLRDAMVESAYAAANPSRGLAAQYDEIADMYRATARKGTSTKTEAKASAHG